MVYSNFSNYLSNNKTQPKESHTHTRIGDKKKIYGGSFNIKNQKEFYDNYYNHVFEDNKKEYLTEKQLPNGQILIDLDFRYTNEIKRRQHNEVHIDKLVKLYVEKIQEIYDIPQNKKFPVFVLEKLNVNCLKDKTKDGIHIIFGISSTAEQQLYLRKKVIENVNNILSDLPLQNSYEDVFDIGISKKTTNWQLFGSQKPHNERYNLAQSYQLFIDDNNSLQYYPLTLDVREILPIISARNTDIVKFDLKIEIPKEIKIKKNKKKVVKNKIIKKKINTFENITSKELLNEIIDLILIDAKEKSKYHIQEAYDYTMGLSNTFYEPYDKWIDIGWTLRCIDDILFPVWIKFSAQSKEFTFDKVQEFYEIWENMEDKGKTIGTLIYYLKDDNLNKYKEIKQKQMGYYINQAVKTETEYDLAICLYHVAFEDFIYSEADGFLYHWNGRFWEKSKEKSKCCIISDLISNRLYNAFCLKESNLLQKMIKILDEKEREKMQNYLSKVADLRLKLRKTTWKKNIESEFRSIIQQKHSIKQEDMNKELGGLVFQNGVVTFTDGIKFGKGGHTKHNYNTFCLPYDYIPYNKENKEHQEQSQVLKTFMRQIFVNNLSRKFMWELMACSIVGKHKQKFIILKGTGGNGKGVLMNLWSAVLGDYYYKAKADVLVDHSVDVRGSNVELAGMAFKRLIMYNELPKRKKFNCAKIKLLTGDKYIKARFNHSNNSKVIQYGLHICDCNFFPFMDEEDTQGNAMRRRNRVALTESKFCDNPSDDEKKMEFQRDDYMGSQAFADKYKAIMMSMLIEIYKRTRGEVKDVEPVMKWTEDYYKKSSDIEEFFKSIIKEKVNNDFGYMRMVSFKDLYSAFRDSPIYSTLTKYDKKKYNKSKLIEICKNRYKDSILLKSRANKFNNKSIEKARTLCGYSSKFNGLVGYYVYNEEEDDSDGEEQVYNNI